MKLRLALATATCLALPIIAQSSAHAQPVTGPYVSLGAGTSIENPSSSGFSNNGFIGNLEIIDSYSLRNQFRPDYSGAAAAGYGFGNGFRVELGNLCISF
jgi:opacity protein-like surface antigen